MPQQIPQPRHPFSTALQRSQSTFGLQGLDFLGKTGGLMLLQVCSECVTAIDVLSVYKAGLELETWPIQDGCSIGTRSSAQMFHSRHLLLLIHNTYWYKNLMELCHPLSLLPAHPSPSCLCQPRSELWLDHWDSLGRGWEHGLYFVLSWAAYLAGLRVQHVALNTGKNGSILGKGNHHLNVAESLQKQLFPVSLTRSCNVLPRHLFTSASLLSFSPISWSFWGQVSQFRKHTNTIDNWLLKLNSCTKVA